MKELETAYPVGTVIEVETDQLWRGRVTGYHTVTYEHALHKGPRVCISTKPPEADPVDDTGLGDTARAAAVRPEQIVGVVD